MLSFLITLISGRFLVNGSTNAIEFILVDCYKFPAHGFGQRRHLYITRNISASVVQTYKKENYYSSNLPFQI